jgi:hypothetical protein
VDGLLKELREIGEPCALKGACIGSGRGRQKRAATHLAGGLLYSNKCIADGAFSFFTARSFHWADGDRVAHIAVSCSVLEQISYLASTGHFSPSNDHTNGNKTFYRLVAMHK